MNRKLLILALFLFAISGLMLHYRIHPFFVTSKINPAEKVFSLTYFWASLLPLIDTVLVTLLFMSRKTAVYAYLLNGLIVIYGTVLMSHFSINYFMVAKIPPSEWILKSTLPDIGIAFGDFFVGKVIYDSYMEIA
ncbi:MAG: hypothetical protein N2999_02495 [Proteobacteria bacterium]|nr:hypothetical protein [Pseudomonadota bacterium]